MVTNIDLKINTDFNLDVCVFFPFYKLSDKIVYGIKFVFGFYKLSEKVSEMPKRRASDLFHQFEDRQSRFVWLFFALVFEYGFLDPRTPEFALPYQYKDFDLV